MLWRGRRESDNIDEGGSAGGGFPGGGGFRIPTGGRGGIGGLGLLVILGLCLYFGVDPRVILDGAGGGPGGGGPVNFPNIQLPRVDPNGNSEPRRRQPGGGEQVQRPQSTSEDDLKKFVSVVLADTEDVWDGVFKKVGKTYEHPRLVLFSRYAESACGMAKAAMGPFYCPEDRKVYIDLSFYQELKNRFKAPGDFAQAYVIAHEVGHHVQTLLGITEQVERAKRDADEDQSNALQVRMELQADCLAGVWANQDQKLNNVLEEGDIDEALNAAAAIGDDRIQKQSQGYVVPDSFTHGSSAQRQKWFRAGFDSGKIDVCDTFKADQP